FRAWKKNPSRLTKLPCTGMRNLAAANSSVMNLLTPIHRKNPRLFATLWLTAGIRGRSGPPGNQNAFRHGLTGIAQRCAEAVLNPAEQSIREEILSGLLSDKGGAARVLAEIIASDVSLLVTFNHAIDGVLQNNPKARANPKALWLNWMVTRGRW